LCFSASRKRDIVDITEAFAAGNVAAQGRFLDTEEAEELKTWINELVDDHAANVKQYLPSDLSEEGRFPEEGISGDLSDHLISMAKEIAYVSFLAGRMYESQFVQTDETFPLDLDKETLQEFIEFLVKRP
jgi:hypothetical protein